MIRSSPYRTVNSHRILLQGEKNIVILHRDNSQGLSVGVTTNSELIFAHEHSIDWHMQIQIPFDLGETSCSWMIKNRSSRSNYSSALGQPLGILGSPRVHYCFHFRCSQAMPAGEQSLNASIGVVHVNGQISLEHWCLIMHFDQSLTRYD